MSWFTQLIKGPLLRYDLLMLNSSPKTTYRLIASTILLDRVTFVNSQNALTSFIQVYKNNLGFPRLFRSIMLIAGIEPATSSLPWMRSAN